ncbi:hypothetical protein JAAARDRAFT_35109 [Jaapia argillacea MUCL 33604]|uniref:Uncharacterized protein n=1 Tax=Jaapia argillacea MUCL 33604 TaxID=933084 RepID=A0A067PWR4_9AGAM|nr:hypothetical protein JAAARDRAFT_35109 [Jaapia argillacea MUCL 33604]
MIGFKWFSDEHRRKQGSFLGYNGSNSAGAEREYYGVSSMICCAATALNSLVRKMTGFKWFSDGGFSRGGTKARSKDTTVHWSIVHLFSTPVNLKPSRSPESNFILPALPTPPPSQAPVPPGKYDHLHVPRFPDLQPSQSLQFLRLDEDRYQVHRFNIQESNSHLSQREG